MEPMRKKSRFVIDLTAEVVSSDDNGIDTPFPLARLYHDCGATVLSFLSLRDTASCARIATFARAWASDAMKKRSRIRVPLAPTGRFLREIAKRYDHVQLARLTTDDYGDAMYELVTLGHAPLRFPMLRRARLGPKISAGRVTIGPFEKPTKILKRARETLTNLRRLSLRAHNCDHAFDQRAALELVRWKSLRVLQVSFDMRMQDVEQATTALQIVRQVRDLHLTITTGYKLRGPQAELMKIVKQIPNHVDYLQLGIDLTWTIDDDTSPEFVPNLCKNIHAELCERFHEKEHHFEWACERDRIAVYFAS